VFIWILAAFADISARALPEAFASGPFQFRDSLDYNFE